MKNVLSYKETWVVDFEFRSTSGSIPDPVCVVAKELFSQQIIKLWLDGEKPSSPPYPISKDTLFIAYYASAEMNCHLALNWPYPVNLVDLYVEFRNHTNGLPTIGGDGLIGAAMYHGIDVMDASEKKSMRDLVLRGGNYTPQEQQSILDYCLEDVIATEKLFNKMQKTINFERAINRGDYMKAAASMEYVGIPIDVDSLAKFREHWDEIKLDLVQNVDTDFGVYDCLTFKAELWANWLKNKNIPWPLLPSGKLDLKDDTFKEMARIYPQVQPIRDLRYALGQMKLNELAVGEDGRNRCMISAFRARTGRNQPSNTKFIFGPAVWLRGLIKPTQGNGIAYVDWSQQEFGIAGALSNDIKMMEAYASGDPYLAFAKQAGAVPPEATKKSHPEERDQFKACVLAVQYAMGAESLAVRINQPVSKAKELLELHRKTYSTFWKWSDAVVDYAMIYGELWTIFGWNIHITSDTNPRMLRNFPMQANGAEMLRLACCLAVDAGIKICAPIHDAILIEAPLSQLDDTVLKMQQVMQRASEIVLNGFALRSDATIVRYPDRYMDPRGKNMWNTVWDILGEPEKKV